MRKKDEKKKNRREKRRTGERKKSRDLRDINNDRSIKNESRMVFNRRRKGQENFLDNFTSPR
jgi:hypothetical protein